MKRVFILVALLAVNAFAQTATTKEGYIACISKEYFNDVGKFLAAKDFASVSAYIKQMKCVSLKSGVTVTVMDYGLLGTSQFAYEGYKFWTNTEALKLK